MFNQNTHSPGSFSFLPPVVKNLLIINGLFFLGTMSLGDAFGIDLVNLLGLHFPGSTDYRWFQWLTYMFMHGNFGHIFFNMFAIWMFGSALENYWGGKKFIIFYLLTGFGAAFTHYAVTYYEYYPFISLVDMVSSDPSYENIMAFKDSPYFYLTSQLNMEFSSFMAQYTSIAESSPSEARRLASEFFVHYKESILSLPVIVGASGALFGILLAYGMTFPNTEILIYFLFPIKAKYFVILYGVIELISGFTSNSNVAHFAHLGGMLFGFILLMIWKKTNFRI